MKIRGGPAASIDETTVQVMAAKANGLKPYFYLRHLFEPLPPAQSKKDYKRLLSQCVDRTQILTDASLQAGFI